MCRNSSLISSRSASLKQGPRGRPRGKVTEKLIDMFPCSSNPNVIYMHSQSLEHFSRAAHVEKEIDLFFVPIDLFFVFYIFNDLPQFKYNDFHWKHVKKLYRNRVFRFFTVFYYIVHFKLIKYARVAKLY